MAADRLLEASRSTSPPSRQQWDIAEAVEACLRARHHAPSAPWRDQVAKVGARRGRAHRHANGLQLTGLCRGGMFPAG